MYSGVSALLRAGLFYRVLKDKSRKIKKVNAKNCQAVADRAGKHSPIENGFSGNGELVGYNGRKKRMCKPTKNHLKKRGTEDQSQEELWMKETNSHKYKWIMQEGNIVLTILSRREAGYLQDCSRPWITLRRIPLKALQILNWCSFKLWSRSHLCCLPLVLGIFQC